MTLMPAQGHDRQSRLKFVSIRMVYWEASSRDIQLEMLQGILAVEGGVDITNPATLKAQLWRGVSQVVCAVGPVFGRTADGNMGYIPSSWHSTLVGSALSHRAHTAFRSDEMATSTNVRNPSRLQLQQVKDYH